MLVQTQQFDGQVHRFVVAKCDAVQTSNSDVVEITGVGKGRPKTSPFPGGTLVEKENDQLNKDQASAYRTAVGILLCGGWSVHNSVVGSWRNECHLRQMLLGRYCVIYAHI